MGTPLKNPPVYLTIVQVRFNAVLKLAEYLPNIQDEMRKLGYPDYETRRDLLININVQDGQPVPIPGSNERFCFGTGDKKHRFHLTAHFLTLQSADYGTYEDFSSKFLQGLALLHQVVGLNYTDRVGLRYLDDIVPKHGEGLGQYLAQEAQGLSARLGGKPQHSFSETLISFENVKLMSRVLIQESELAFPPDLQPDGLAVNDRFLKYQGLRAVVDTDGFVDGRSEFSIENVKQELDAIHLVVRKAFRDSVTDYAYAVWNEE